tara:strand:+ start:65 stop:172 length:108 start_codon:yes stop_codon:yes gene_type:complete
MKVSMVAKYKMSELKRLYENPLKSIFLIQYSQNKN